MVTWSTVVVAVIVNNYLVIFHSIYSSNICYLPITYLHTLGMERQLNEYATREEAINRQQIEAREKIEEALIIKEQVS